MRLLDHDSRPSLHPPDSTLRHGGASYFTSAGCVSSPIRDLRNYVFPPVVRRSEELAATQPWDHRADPATTTRRNWRLEPWFLHHEEMAVEITRIRNMTTPTSTASPAGWVAEFNYVCVIVPLSGSKLWMSCNLINILGFLLKMNKIMAMPASWPQIQPYSATW